MNLTQRTTRIMTGDWVGSAWDASPVWTPYASAIAEHYPIQVPLFVTVPVTLGNVPLEPSIPITVLTRPQLYDSLIFGFSASQSQSIAQAGTPYLNITHQETGIPWVAPNQIGYAPLAAFAGYVSNTMPVMRLPDVFFLPRLTQLKIEWLRSRIDQTPGFDVILNMHGVQLINHTAGFKAPARVTMPNGDEIEVGSRIPWFGCIPFGSRPNVPGSRAFFNYTLDSLKQTVSYAPPNSCDVEIHDVYASFLDSTFEFAGAPNLLKTKIDDTQIREDWTPQFTPVQAVYGQLASINQCLPFIKPQVLEQDHKILMVAQNNDPLDVDDGTVTFRGVRRCEY